MSRRDDWEALCEELGFKFERGIQGFMDSAIGRLELEERASKGEIPKGALALLDNPMVRAMLEMLFDGAGTGTYRGFEFNIFPSSHRSSNSGTSTPLSNVVLFFKKSYELDLRVYNETFLSRIGKVLFFQQDVQLGSPELDKLVMIKGNNALAVKDLLDRAAVRAQLLQMFQLSTGFELRDHGIRHQEATGVITRKRALELMDRMVELAQSLSHDEAAHAGEFGR